MDEVASWRDSPIVTLFESCCVHEGIAAVVQREPHYFVLVAVVEDSHFQFVKIYC